MTISVKAPGSCGELAQGTIDGQPFLITCPIDWFSEAVVGTGDHNTALSGRPKAQLAVNAALSRLQLPPDTISLHIDSDIPIGKGMASSSADISAACQAAALACGRSLTADEIADIALSIEPTDGIFYPDIILFDHVRGNLRQPLGRPPELHIAVFDAGGEIDTLEFNRRMDLSALNKAKEKDVRAAVDLIKKGLAENDVSRIGEGATLSSLANQMILKKDCLSLFVREFPHCGAVGVNIAHSGTVIGVLFPPIAMQNMTDFAGRMESLCPGVRHLRNVRLIPGGLNVIKG